MKRRRTTTKRRTAAQRRATARLIAFNKKRRAPKRRRPTTRRVSPMKRRRRRPAARTTARRRPARRRATTLRQNPRRRPIRGVRRVRRRLYTRNPGFRSTLKELAIGSVGIIGGEVAMNLASRATTPLALKLGTNPMVHAAVSVVTALGIGMLSSKVLPREFGKYVALGAFTTAVRQTYNAVTGGMALAPSLPGAGSVAGYFGRGGNGGALRGYARPGLGAGYDLSTGAGNVSLGNAFGYN